MKHYIYIIDDDSFANDLYKIIIGMTPYESYVTIEDNALKALDDLCELDKNSPRKFPRYILLDLHMPELNGFEFIHEFESRFPACNTEFIVITSSILNKDRERALSFNSVRDFLVKPIPRNYIETIIVEGHHPDLVTRHF